ncbi:hypothetical protein DFS33DRAFT_1377837 [Desarmillaria ectypa]|nr:hypothetical protein DFS33DRAFT_1377837 [Desarmillaria ectypa]
MPKFTYKRAEPDGTVQIIHSRATKLYKLTPTDLQSISPVRQERNHHGGWITCYNTGDVERLQRSLQGRSATRKKASGPRIAKTGALSIFNPHPKYNGLTMHLYSREEVKAVAKRLYGPSYKSTAAQLQLRYPAGQGRYDGLLIFVATPASSTLLPLTLAANNLDYTLNFVWFEDVCEDAIAIIRSHLKNDEAGDYINTIDGGAYLAEDKDIQHNSCVNIINFLVSGARRKAFAYTSFELTHLFSSTGLMETHCKSQCSRNVYISGVYAEDGGTLAGINSNYDLYCLISPLLLSSTNGTLLPSSTRAPTRAAVARSMTGMNANCEALQWSSIFSEVSFIMGQLPDILPLP